MELTSAFESTDGKLFSFLPLTFELSISSNFFSSIDAIYCLSARCVRKMLRSYYDVTCKNVIGRKKQKKFLAIPWWLNFRWTKIICDEKAEIIQPRREIRKLIYSVIRVDDNVNSPLRPHNEIETNLPLMMSIINCYLFLNEKYLALAPAHYERSIPIFVAWCNEYSASKTISKAIRAHKYLIVPQTYVQWYCFDRQKLYVPPVCLVFLHMEWDR